MNLYKELHNSGSVFLAPLGGLGEIGMNMMAFIHKGEAVVLDCGALFPESNQVGIDIITPKIDFFKEYDLKVKAIVFTHGHEDHIGSAPYLYDFLGQPDIYATEFTLGMIETRMREYSAFKKEKAETIKLGKKFKISAFEFEALRVTHSLVDCVGLAIDTPVGRIVHSGDFKIDRAPIDKAFMDEKKFEKFGDEGTLLLMSDSTNVASEGWTRSEQEVGDSLSKIIANIKTGKIIVTLFSSNILRLHSLFSAAKNSNRKIALAGRSVHFNTELARQLGYLKFSDDLFIDTREVGSYEPEEVMIVCTGTQAEPRSALMKMSVGSHPDLTLDKGDTVIFSSRHIPGNEKRISNLMNNIYRMGAHTIDWEDDLVHASGHARRDELKALQTWVRPKYFLPVHGEYRMLVEHFELAKEIRPETLGLVAENGDLLELRADGFKKLTKFDYGKLYLDEERNFLSEIVIRERKKLAASGMVIVSMVAREKDFKVLSGPEFISTGLPNEVDWIALQDEILQSFSEVGKVDIEAFEEEVRLSVRRAFRKWSGIKPQVFPSIYLV